MEYELSLSQSKALEDIVNHGKSGLLTGAAGTGKSFLVKEICEMFQKKGKKYAVTASTGLAAVLLNGVTVYNYFWINPTDLDKEPTINYKKINKYKSFKQKLKELQILIIEEISMININIFQRVHDMLCYVKNCSAPFGGLQVLLVGDFFQLPPVKEKQFLFETSLFWETCDEMWDLKEVFRQKDPKFCEFLHRIRNGTYNPDDVQILQSRVGIELDTKGIQSTVLLSKKFNIQSLNEARLRELPEVSHFFPIKSGYHSVKTQKEELWEYAIQDLKKDIDLPNPLELKKGAQVMLACNFDVNDGLCNGTKGVVVDFIEVERYNFDETTFHKKFSEKEILQGILKQGYLQHVKLPLVELTNGKKYVIPYIRWTREKEDLGGEVYCWQIPLRLAWNATIHRSQGQSLDYVEISLGTDVFEDGQAYVALSRAKTLEGLTLSQFDSSSIKTNEKVKDFYMKPFELQKYEMFMPKTKKTKTKEITKFMIVKDD